MPISPTALPFESPPDLSVIRERKGIKLEDISRTTKISTRYLEAIERCDFRVLPGGVFNTSYLRQYARAIDFDEWDLLACYKARTRGPMAEPPAAASERAGSRWPRFAFLRRFAVARKT